MDSFRPGTGSTAVEANCGRFRSLPPWIASYEENGPPAPEPQQTAPSRPPQTAQADHNNAPVPPQRRVSRDGFVAWDDAEPSMPLKKKHLAMKRRRQTQRGKKWDHLRSAEPVIIPNHMMRYADSTSPWTGFVQASRYGRIPGERSQHVESEKLEELMPGFNDAQVPRLPNTLEQRIRRSRRQALHEQVWRLLLNNPLVPALLRLFVLVTSAISLAFSGNLWLLYSDRAGGPGATLRSQWIVAIVVDCIVMPYVCYMTWDEYRGLQLGLRSPMQKVSLTLMDLFFIIFKSASTTLAFDSLNINNSPRDQNVKMKALASFLLLGLFGWILNFTVNVFRLVRRLGGEEDRRPLS